MPSQREVSGELESLVCLAVAPNRANNLTTPVRQLEIEEHEVEVGSEPRGRFRARPRLDEGVPLTVAAIPQREAQEIVVVHDKDRRCRHSETIGRNEFEP